MVPAKKNKVNAPLPQVNANNQTTANTESSSSASSISESSHHSNSSLSHNSQQKTAIASINGIQVVNHIPEVKHLQPIIMESVASPSTATATKSLMSPSTAGNTSANDETTEIKQTGDIVKDRCKDRLDAFKKDLKKTMPLSDQLDMRDP